MAKLYPLSLSQVDNIPESEKRLFDRLQSLDDSYHVFHSVAWSEIRDGECDFIIFNEQKGFIALEIKEERIDFDGKRWSSIDAQGKLTYIKDPVKQARDTMRAVRRVYEERYNTPLPGIQTWGVCFLDCKRGKEFKTLDIPEANIMDFNDKISISEWVGNLFRINEDYHGVKVLSDTERNNFITLFSRKLHIPLSLNRIVIEQQRMLASADYMQEYLLDLFEDKSRIAFQGSAGTGKTWIAMKKAVRLAASGKRVLFLCYNSDVCGMVASRLEPYRNIGVMTFHSFSNSVIREYVASEIKRHECEHEFFSCITELLDEGGGRNSLSVKRRYSGGKNLDLRVHGALFSLGALSYGENYDTVLARYEDILPIDIIDLLSLLMPDESGKDSFYDIRMPLALSQVFENDHISLAKFSYDAAIVDEAQDFHMSWCDSLRNLFEKYKNRTVYVFYDENQTLFRREKELPIRELISRTDHNHYIFRLRDNLRNTADIHRFSVEKTGLAASSRSFDIQGVLPVEAEFRGAESAVSYTGEVLNSVISEYRIDPERITILSNRSLDSSVFSEKKKAGGFNLVPSGNLSTAGGLRFRTINEFRGLESDVVILIIHKRDAEFADKKRYLSEELLYVGFTRARHLLYVVTVIP